MYIYIYIIQIYSGITCGRVLNGELYLCKLYKLINLCWSTGCFVILHFTPRDDFIAGFSTVNIQDLAGLCCYKKFRRLCCEKLSVDPVLVYRP